MYARLWLVDTGHWTLDTKLHYTFWQMCVCICICFISFEFLRPHRNYANYSIHRCSTMLHRSGRARARALPGNRCSQLRRTICMRTRSSTPPQSPLTSLSHFTINIPRELRRTFVKHFKLFHLLI